MCLGKTVLAKTDEFSDNFLIIFLLQINLKQPLKNCRFIVGYSDLNFPLWVKFMPKTNKEKISKRIPPLSLYRVNAKWSGGWWVANALKGSCPLLATYQLKSISDGLLKLNVVQCSYVFMTKQEVYGAFWALTFSWWSTCVLLLENIENFSILQD